LDDEIEKIIKNNVKKKLIVLTFKTHDRSHKTRFDYVEDKPKKKKQQSKILNKKISQPWLTRQPRDHDHWIWIIL
jgi:hypothetical protein